MKGQDFLNKPIIWWYDLITCVVNIFQYNYWRINPRYFTMIHELL